MTQLAKLAKRIPPAYIEKAPQGKYGEYCAHHVITQALLATVGPFDLEVKEILRGYVPEQVRKKGKPDEYTLPAIDSAVVGAVIRLTVTIDERRTVIEEAGDCEDPQNWLTDGARLKDCVSDGIKRCAARVGLGLHLWAQEHYFLDKSLESRNALVVDDNPRTLVLRDLEAARRSARYTNDDDIRALLEIPKARSLDAAIRLADLDTLRTWVAVLEDVKQ